MKQLLIVLCAGACLASCGSKKDEKKDDKMDGDKKEAGTSENKSSVDLPYTAGYTANWDANVSDEDVKTVLDSYKFWSENELDKLMGVMADTVTVDFASGLHAVHSNADLRKTWASHRDSLSSIRITMDSWHKMHATDKGDSYVVVWYNEYDTYKDGHVDSAAFHDINQLKGGKISWYSTYKRPLKEK